MRILMLARDYKPLIGGVAEYSHQMAAGLHHLGHQVRVLAAACHGDQSFDAACPYPLQRVPWVSHTTRSLLDNLSTYRRLSAVLCEHRAQILVANSIFSEPLLCRALAARHGIPWAVFAYGREVDRRRSLAAGLSIASRLKKRIKTRAWRRADRIVCISQFTRDLIAAHGISLRRIAVVPPGVSVPNTTGPDSEAPFLSTLRGRFRGRRIVLTVGRLVQRKGVETTIDAMVEVARRIPEVVYVVVGDGPCRDLLERQVADHGLARHVSFEGRVSDAAKAAYFELAELFVMANHATTEGDVEGYGIVFLEANAYGKPVIGGRSGGVPEAVIDGTTGLLVDPGDVDGLADAITRVLGDHELADRLGHQGRQRVENELSWEQAARNMERVLAGLVEHSS